MQRAAGVVAMGGYNTFCEILSFDKKRSSCAHAATTGAVHPHPRCPHARPARDARAERGRDPHAMATALRQLTSRPAERRGGAGLLDGIGNVLRLVNKQLAHPIAGRRHWTPSSPAPSRRRSTTRRPSRAAQDLSAQDSHVGVECARRGRAEGLAAPSETFIAQEIAGLEARGVALEICRCAAHRQGAPSGP